MTVEINRFVNQLMEANCFVVVDHDSESCLIIDPASENAENEINYIEENHLHLDYVLITHTHADHCWGANSLKRRYPEMKLLYHEDKYMNREIMLFFRMWHENVNYRYVLAPSENPISDGYLINWHGHQMKFVLTPGHSEGSICIEIDGVLFTGDTIMPFPPYFNGRGSDKTVWEKSVKKLVSLYKPETKIYPGHGDALTLGEWMSKEEYSRYKE